MSDERTPEAMASAMRAIEAAFLLERGLTLPGATEVWLVRHGDCYEGVAGDDPGLSPLGREQARRLGERVRRLPHAAVYASPLRRAVETARAIGPDVRLDDRLVELQVELVDGRVLPAESPDDAAARMRAAVADAVAAHPGARVVLVSHAAAILSCLCDVLHLDAGSLRLLPYYTSISVVRVLGDRRMAGGLGDVAHLEWPPGGD